MKLAIGRLTYMVATRWNVAAVAAAMTGASLGLNETEARKARTDRKKGG